MAGKGRPTGPKGNLHTLSDFMNAKIEMNMREEGREAGREPPPAQTEPQSAFATSSSGSRLAMGSGPGTAGGYVSPRPSSRASSETQGGGGDAVSSSAGGSDPEASQPGSEEGGGDGGAGGRGRDRDRDSSGPQPSDAFQGMRGAWSDSSSSSNPQAPSSSLGGRAMSPSVGSSQPTKKRIMHRPRFRGDDPQPISQPQPPGPGAYPPVAAGRAEHPRGAGPGAGFTPSSSGAGNKAVSPVEISPRSASSSSAAGGAASAPAAKPTSSSSASVGAGHGSGQAGKDKKSDLYDFPDDSPDEDSTPGRTMSSYMALGGITGRSPRKPGQGQADSSDSARPAGVQADTSGVGSSEDRQKDGAGNEAQGFESFPPGSHYGSQRRESGGGDADSTERDKAASSSSSTDDASGIDSSTTPDGQRPKARRSPRPADDATEPSQGSGGEKRRGGGAEGGAGFGGVDSSSSDRSPVAGGGAGGQGSNPGQVSSMMRESGDHQAPVCSRELEPAPLLSAQYETLSDDEDN